MNRLSEVPAWLLVSLAPFIGSFLGVLVWRLPRGEGVVAGRSRCPRCGTRLTLFDLVPLMSWLALRGRCRSCRAPIGLFYPAIELAAIGVAVWAALITSGWVLWATCVLGWVLLTLAIIDWRHHLLPDVLTLPLIPAGLAAGWLIEPSEVLDHAIGTVAGFAVFAGLAWLYRAIRKRDGLGLGDAKLLAGIGAWVGWQGLPSAVLIAAALGLMLALGRTLREQGLSLSDRLPFGTYLAAASWFTWLYGPLAFG